MASSVAFVIFLCASVPLFFPAAATILFPKDALPTKSGYLPVNTTSGSAIFFTFYEAQQPSSPLSQTPLLVWLQGGPGCSSMLGNFLELGPWLVTSDPTNRHNLTLNPNPGSWNRLFGLIFIDNPIGAGFSVAASPGEIPRDQTAVARHLFIALTSFLSANPTFSSRPLYLTGESYAGKYVPAFGYYLLNQNSRLSPSRQINLQGVAIGDGLTHPVTQVATHAVTAYFSGLINRRQQTQLEQLQIEAVRLTREEKWQEAREARNKVLDALLNMTGLPTLYDFRRQKPYETQMVTDFLQNEEVKKVLGAKGNIVFEVCSDTVDGALSEDVMKSVKFMVESLVRKSKVLLYQGQFDLQDGVVSTEAWVQQMEWKELEMFLMAERKVWEVNGVLSGYVQRWGGLTLAVVSGAGHLVPTDQSLSSQAMIEDWILEKGMFSNESRGTIFSKPSNSFRD
ncbi:serine carboxypeptidase-like 50 [Aristolochia californica]|uniref:serine carboxypeptidase-like 50 n=1 Tax=Aristolochia californica TaxID=171875 RepID=UPI0035E0936E